MAGRADGSGGHVLGIQADFRNHRFLFMDPNRGIYSFDTFDDLSEKVSQLLEYVYRERYKSFFTTQYFRSPSMNG